MIVGLVPAQELQGNLTPVAAAADYAMGRFGVILVSIAALLAFISVANAGLMSASRYPLAMSRDHLLPPVFRKLSKFGTPLPSILLTLGVVLTILILLDPMRIAKLASSFQLLMFALVCLAVIVMRESRIDSYDPGYKSPLYPWMQIAGILLPFFLIFEMGLVPILFSTGLIIVSTLWYFYFARQRTSRNGAIYHVFERLGRHRHHDLDSELRGILREKGLRSEDPFDEIVSRSQVLDLDAEAGFENLVTVVACKLQSQVSLSSAEIKQQIMDGTRIGATPVTRGIALPHFRTDRIEQAEMVLVRAKQGVLMTLYNPLTHEDEEEVRIHALFFLVSPEQDPAQHLRILARIAERVEEDSFVLEWEKATDEHELRQTLLHDERFLTLTLSPSGTTADLIDKPLHAAEFHQGCLVAMLHRSGQSFVPNGNTVLKPGDRLTIIGNLERLAKLKETYQVK
jgi:mannitol/fructose-specific phosphotransferase system IIA component (Ntr-type)